MTICLLLPVHILLFYYNYITVSLIILLHASFCLCLLAFKVLYFMHVLLFRFVLVIFLLCGAYISQKSASGEKEMNDCRIKVTTKL